MLRLLHLSDIKNNLYYLNFYNMYVQFHELISTLLNLYFSCYILNYLFYFGKSSLIRIFSSIIRTLSPVTNILLPAMTWHTTQFGIKDNNTFV